jgi:hypothetical protein
MEIFSWEVVVGVVVDGFIHLQWLDRLVKQKKTIGDGSDRSADTCRAVVKRRRILPANL